MQSVMMEGSLLWVGNQMKAATLELVLESRATAGFSSWMEQEN